MSFSFPTSSLDPSTISCPLSAETERSPHNPLVADEKRRTQFSSPFSIRAILSSSSTSPASDRFLPSFSYRQLLFAGESGHLNSSSVQSLRCFQHAAVASSDWKTSKEQVNRQDDTRKEGRKAPKRSRTVFTPAQLERLEGAFSRQQYVAGEERRRLAASLQLTETHVKVWFQNRRIRFRKQGLQQTSTATKSRVGREAGLSSSVS